MLRRQNKRKWAWRFFFYIRESRMQKPSFE